MVAHEQVISYNSSIEHVSLHESHNNTDIKNSSLYDYTNNILTMDYKCPICHGECKKCSLIVDQYSNIGISNGNFNGNVSICGGNVGINSDTTINGGIFAAGGKITGEIKNKFNFNSQLVESCKRPSITEPKSILIDTYKPIKSNKTFDQYFPWKTFIISHVIFFIIWFTIMMAGLYDNDNNCELSTSIFMFIMVNFISSVTIILPICLYLQSDSIYCLNKHYELSSNRWICIGENPKYTQQLRLFNSWNYKWICMTCGRFHYFNIPV